MENMVYFIKTNQITQFAVFNNYMYKKNKSNNEMVYYQCKNAKCNSTLNLKNGVISKVTDHNSHPSHQIEILKQLAINEMKMKVIFYSY